MTSGAVSGLSSVKKQDNAVNYAATCMLHATSRSLIILWRIILVSRAWERRHSRNVFTLAGMTKNIIHKKFVSEWNSANQGDSVGRVLDLDTEARIVGLPAYFALVETIEIFLKLQRPLLTR